jgi:hypothetical protein
MESRCWLALACLCLIASPSASPRQNRDAVTTKRTDCDKDSDLRYAVCRGDWSANAVALFNTWMTPDTNPERRLDLPSPDGEKVIRVRGFHVRLYMNGKQYWTPFGSMHDAEVGWAPDSTRLFVTWTETGELGPWHTDVYEIEADGLKAIPGVTQHVRNDLITRMKRAAVPKWVSNSQERAMWDGLHYCAYDVVGSRWMNGSKELLVAGLAGPDGGCKYMGDFVAYRLKVETGEILQVYSAREAVRTFGDRSLPRIFEDAEAL